MSTIAEHVDRELVRALIVHQITCPRTGTLLDVRTAVVVRGADGDPVAVLSQQGYRENEENGTADDLRGAGYTFTNVEVA